MDEDSKSGKNISLLNIDFNCGSDVAIKFLDMIEKATGAILGPHQLKRIAKAKAESDQMFARSQIKISDLESRALARILRREAVAQKNIEEIMSLLENPSPFIIMLGILFLILICIGFLYIFF